MPAADRNGAPVVAAGGAFAVPVDNLVDADLIGATVTGMLAVPARRVSPCRRGGSNGC